jgi:hypothetical protein
MNSNNPLAVEPETENDTAQEELRKPRKLICHRFGISLCGFLPGCGGWRDDDKDFLK